MTEIFNIQSPHGNGCEAGQQIFANVAQELANTASYDEACQQIDFFHEDLVNMPEVQRQSPEETELRIAKLCRDAALGPVTFGAAIKCLHLLKENAPLVPSAPIDPVDAHIEDFWTNTSLGHVELGTDDLSFLRALFSLKDTCFNAAIEDLQERQPHLLRLWRERGRDVYSAAQKLCSAIRQRTELREELSQRDLELLRYNEPMPSTALEQLRATNGTATLLTASVLLIEQRHSGNALSGAELSQVLLNNLQRATGLVGGRRNTVTDKLTVPGDFHDPAYLAGKLSMQGMFLMGPFVKRHYAAVPGDCAAYPLFSPGLHAVDREGELALIQWLRTVTNNGVCDGNNPPDALRPCEAFLTAGARICGEQWGDTRPFQPVPTIV